MAEIERYDVIWNDEELKPYPDGNLVFHDDHLAELAAKDEEIERLRMALRDACSHGSMTQTGDGNMRCDRCGFVEPDPFYMRPGGNG